MSTLRFCAFAASIFSLAACGGAHNSSVPQIPQAANHTQTLDATSAFEMDMLRPDAPNPGTIKVAPMPVRARVPASVMLGHAGHSVAPASIGTMKYSLIPGSAQQVVASPDGSLWALSTQPAGADKYIFHYVNGTWTNVSGAASYIAIDGAGQQLFAINSVSGGVYQLNIPTGQWYSLGGGARAVACALTYDPSTQGFDDIVYVLSNRVVNGNSAIFEYYGGNFYQVAGAGSLIGVDWDFATWNVQGLGTVAGGGVYIGNAAGSIFYFTPTFGHPGQGSYQKFPGAATALAPTMGGLFALGPPQAGGAPVYYFDFNPGSWSSKPGIGVGISASQSNLFVLTNSNAIYSATLGSDAAVVSLPSGTQGKFITLGSDNNLWFVSAQSGVGKYNPSSNTYALYNTPVAPGHGRITVGSDKNMYFTVAKSGVSGADVYEVTPAGTITGFQAPTSTSNNNGIATGSDGNLWIAEASLQKIAKFTVPGHVWTEYPVTQNGSTLGGVVNGPDGAIWYTEEDASAIGRITTAGVHTNDFPTPTAAAFPSDIVVGKDGNMWFTELGAGKIGKITPAGVITEYPVPSGVPAQPYGLTLGPDGNIWYVDSFSEFVGRITPAGVATEYPSPAGLFNSFLVGIAAGPDGNLYFPDAFAATMDRISPSNP